MQTTILRILLLALVSVFLGCGKSSHEQHEDVADEGGDVLATELDKIHNEAMGKMGEIMKLKRDLKARIDSSATMIDEEKKDIENMIATLDSSYNEMMDWMHQYNPDNFSAGTEEYREYLETEMEKIKKIKRDILDAIERAKEERAAEEKN